MPRSAAPWFAAVFLLAASACVSEEEWVSFEAVAKGYYSNFADPQPLLYAFDDPGIWKKFRAATLMPGSPGHALEIAPGEILLAVFRGQQRTGGYEVTLKSVRIEGQEVKVVAILVKPAPGQAVSEAFTSAYLVGRLEHKMSAPQTKLFVLLDESYRPVATTRLNDWESAAPVEEE